MMKTLSLPSSNVDRLATRQHRVSADRSKARGPGSRVALIIAATVAAGAGCSGNSNTDGLEPVRSSAEMPLIAGDQIRLTISAEPDLSGDFRVDETLMLHLPLLDAIDVDGMSAEALRGQIFVELEKQLRNQSIDVMVLRRVGVLGSVTTPGVYYVDPTMNLVDVIALAGGATSDGDLPMTSILRGGEQIWDQEDLPTFELQSGDEVYVPLKGWVVRNATWLIGLTVTTTLILLTRTYR